MFSCNSWRRCLFRLQSFKDVDELSKTKKKALENSLMMEAMNSNFSNGIEPCFVD